MIDPPTILHTEAQPAAVLRLKIPRAEMRSAMGPAHAELMKVIAAQGVVATGPWFSHHFRMDPTTFDFEIGVPVSSPVEPSGRVTPGELPAARVVRTVYHGNYEGLGAGWGELGEWIVAEGHTTRPDLWEIYAAGPESSDDPAEWRTELNRPLAD